jgi:hypothetical protein
MFKMIRFHFKKIGLKRDTTFPVLDLTFPVLDLIFLVLHSIFLVLHLTY